MIGFSVVTPETEATSAATSEQPLRWSRASRRCLVLVFWPSLSSAYGDCSSFWASVASSSHYGFKIKFYIVEHKETDTFRLSCQGQQNRPVISSMHIARFFFWFAYSSFYLSFHPFQVKLLYASLRRQWNAKKKQLLSALHRWLVLGTHSCSCSRVCCRRLLLQLATCR